MCKTLGSLCTVINVILYFFMCVIMNNCFVSRRRWSRKHLCGRLDSQVWYLHHYMRCIQGYRCPCMPRQRRLWLPSCTSNLLSYRLIRRNYTADWAVPTRVLRTASHNTYRVSPSPWSHDQTRSHDQAWSHDHFYNCHMVHF
jgi:hypothetical protein